MAHRLPRQRDIGLADYLIGNLFGGRNATGGKRHLFRRKSFIVGAQPGLVGERGVEVDIERSRRAGEVGNLSSHITVGRIEAHTVCYDIVDSAPRRRHRCRLKDCPYRKILGSGYVVVGLDQPRSKSRTEPAGIVGTHTHRIGSVGGEACHGIAGGRDCLFGLDLIKGVTHLYGVALGTGDRRPGYGQLVESSLTGLDIGRGAKAHHGLRERYDTIGNGYRRIVPGQIGRGISNGNIDRRNGLLGNRRSYRCRKGGIARRDRERGCGIGVAHREGLRLHIIGTRARGEAGKIDVFGLDIPRACYLYIAEILTQCT